MKHVLRVLLAISWALWFGGMIALIIFVTRLFQANHPIAVEAAPVLFRAFGVYQLIMGMIACISGTLLAMITGRKIHAAMSLLMILALAAALLIRGWTNRMENIRLAGQSGGPEFQMLHKRSSAAYTAAASLLLVAGIGFVVSHRSIPRELHKQTSDSTEK